MSKRNRKSNAAAAAVVEDLGEGVTLEEGTEIVASPEIANEIDQEIEGIVEGAEIVVDSESVEQVAGELQTEEAKQQAYASQAPEQVETTGTVTTDEEDKTGLVTPAAPKAPRAARVKHATVGDAIIATLGGSRESAQAFFALEATDSLNPADLQATMDETLGRINKLDKKSREKALGVFSAAANSSLPSLYITRAIEGLASEGAMTLKQLVAYFQTKWNYKPGTAARQAQQMFALLPVLKITSRDPVRGSAMSLNDNSTLLSLIRTNAAAKSSS